ncbi:MAG: hypothetical protein ACO3C1_07520 [Ilumatobacteraceae bacterium]
MRRLTLPDTTRGVVSMSVAVACAAAVVRTVALGGLDRWVTAGDAYTDPSTVPGGISVLAGDGYDGQFFYRLALHPWRLGIGPFDGIRFDTAFRAGRIAYPALAWLVSLGGRPALVPAALVLVNLAAIGVLAWAGSHLAVSSGMRAAWGLVLPSFVGVAFSFSRDLSEIVAAAAVFSALHFLRRDRVGPAALALVVAVLSREQSVLAVAALAVGVLVTSARAKQLGLGVARAATVAVVPAIAFVTWQVVAARQVGQWPALVSSDRHTSAPSSPFPTLVWRWARESVGDEWVTFAFVALVIVVTTVVMCFVSGGLRTAWRAHPGEVLLGAVALAVVIEFYGRTTDPSYFRQAYELSGVSWLIAWQGRPGVAHRALWVVVPLTVVAVAVRLLIV